MAITRSGKGTTPSTARSTVTRRTTGTRKSQKAKKVNTGTANDAIKRIENLPANLINEIEKRVKQQLIDEARLSWLVDNKAELYKQGESDVEAFFKQWLKGTGDTVAYHFLDAEGMRLYEKVEKMKLTVCPSKQHKYMLDHLKYKYKHLRLGKKHPLQKKDKKRAHEFWQTLANKYLQTFANKPLAKQNVIDQFIDFMTAIQSGIDEYFYLRTEVYKP
tara:strand:+ start:22 stop:675 length:654 start_codon:yes stop_codon:yes gene_type:complete